MPAFNSQTLPETTCCSFRFYITCKWWFLARNTATGFEAYGLQEPQLLAFQMAESCLTLFKALFQTASRVVESKSQDPGGSKVAHRQWVPTLGHLWSRKQKQWRLRLDKLLQCFQVTVTSTQREGQRERESNDRNKKCNESVLKTSFTHRSTHSQLCQFCFYAYLTRFTALKD